MVLITQSKPPPRRRHRQRIMSDIQVLATMVLHHYADSRNFKIYYLKHLQKEHETHFPKILSYSRFIKRKCVLVEHFKTNLDYLKGKYTRVSYVDSTLYNPTNSQGHIRTKPYVLLLR